MAEKLSQFKTEANEFNKKKLLETIDENLGFHEWMEKHRRSGTGAAEGSSSLCNELDTMELIRLGEAAGVTHPFACASSPYFNNHTKEFMLEVKNPTPEQRPFQDLKNLQLFEVSNRDTKEPKN
jgi:hypothetical protein